nr:aldolase/citrate lyase family protein [Geothermobacter ehrlichii]
MKLNRSFLFMPANNERFIYKCLYSEADAIIIDLEDAVAISDKGNARRAFASAINVEHDKSCYVRINSAGTLWWEKDLEAAIDAKVDGIMLPKADDVKIVKTIAERLTSYYDLIPLIETAKGVLNAYEIADSSNKISRLLLVLSITPWI